MSDLYELPNGWEWKKLEKLTKLQNGFAFKSNLFVDSGLPIVRIKNIKNEKVFLDDVVCFNPNDYGKKLDTYKIKKNDLLIAMSGATTGKIGLYDRDEESYLNQRVGLFRIENSDLRSYLFYFLSTQIEKNLAQSLGAAQPNLSSQQINEMEIPTPPLSEQQRIVSKLDLLFEKIDKSIALHQKNMDEADVFMGSVLNDVFGELEEKYPIKTLNDVFLIQRGGSPRPIKEYITDDKDGINWIKISDATKGDGKYIDLTEQKIKPSGLIKSRLVVEGDFIMSNSMSFGRPYIVKTKGAIHDGWLLMREKMEDVDKDYFYHLLSSGYMYQQFSNKASGTTVKNLNIDLVKSSNVILPPLQVQQKVVKYLDDVSEKIEKVKSVQKEKMDSLKALKASILDKAFRGEL